MEVTGTVTSVRHRSTPHGSRYLTVTLARPGTHDIRLTWLRGFKPEPAKGQLITITGMPLMYSPRRGHITTNISVFGITIHETDDQPEIHERTSP